MKIGIVKKVMPFLKKIWKLKYVIEFILSILLCKSLFNVIYFKHYHNIWSLNHLIATGVTGLILLFIIIMLIKENKNKLEKVFLSISIPLAIGYAIFMMILYVPDEHSHLSRAFNISRGNIFISYEQHDEYIPKTLMDIQKVSNYKELVEAKKEGKFLEGEETHFFNAFEIYFPIIYIGPAVGSGISNILHMNIIDTMYLMRIMNIILYIVLGYFTIKWIPFGKLLTMSYLCVPMVIHEAASVAGDAFINSMCLLFIAFNMKLLFKKEKYTLKEKVTYFIIALLATLNKTAYVPLVFLAILLMFKKDKIVDKKDKIFMIATIIIMIAISGLWYIVGTNYEDTREYIIENGISSSNQLSFIKSNPIQFSKVMIKTISEKTSEYLFQALGEFMARLTIKQDIIIPTVYLIMLIFAPFLEKSELSFNKWQRVYLILMTLGIYVLVLFAQYLGWTKVGGDIVEGVQGRYFLPFLILPLLCLIQKNKYLHFKNTVTVYTILIGIINIMSLTEVVNCFF